MSEELDLLKQSKNDVEKKMYYASRQCEELRIRREQLIQAIERLEKGQLSIQRASELAKRKP